MLDLDRLRGLMGGSGTPGPVLFIGAGISSEIGFPTWRQFMQELIDHGLRSGRMKEQNAQLCIGLLDSGDYLAAGEHLRHELGPRVDRHIRERFSKAPQNLGSYDYLVRLPFAGIITTNYDSCLETAYARHHRLPILTLHPDDPGQLGLAGSGQPFLLKLHGDAARGSAVVSASDYTRIERNEPLQTLLSAVFFSHPIVFLGYGVSDRDILTPLAKLASLYTGATAPKLALMPDTLRAEDRLKLEDTYRVDVAAYGTANGHKPVGMLIRTAFADHESRSGRHITQAPEDFAEIVSFEPALCREALVACVERDISYLMKLPHHWGPSIDNPPRAANIAEMLLALKASQGWSQHQAPPSSALRSLLDMAAEEGRIKSLTMPVTNLQTHASSVLAIGAWADLDPEAPGYLEDALDWLESQAHPEGWPRFSGDADVSQVCTLVSLLALTRHGRDADSIWHIVRPKISAVLVRQLHPDKGMPTVIAGWTLMYLAEREKQSRPNEADVALRSIALELLNDPGLILDDELERLPYREGSGELGWRTWHHVTAAICALGLLAWRDQLGQQVVGPLGRCVARLLAKRTAAEGEDTLVFPVIYRVLAISHFLTGVFGEPDQQDPDALGM